ncbi:hypothetical protein [Edaphobacter modestus]|uniref:Uncharacterized protein n=1 Tax=Edaphobacter modestus TaxID=388466 RepID=A0A4Q7YU47_9BACT|nr:hypothetical protein [Edaphobacter modestus]RZU41128.1 hypothetical protein BDD14_2627 [Edaphobacter modestus]
MLSEWSVECGADDPVLVVPWADPDDPSRHFIDLRENPYDLDWLEEAAQHPPLMHALRALNATRSPVFTAKCDVWSLAPDELEPLRHELDLILEDAPTGIASYIDLVWRERSVFVSFHQHEQLLHRITRLATSLEHPYAALECTLRPALIDLTGPQEGFTVSLYLKALGHDEQAAEDRWGAALADVSTLLRGRAFATS